MGSTYRKIQRSPFFFFWQSDGDRASINWQLLRVGRILCAIPFFFADQLNSGGVILTPQNSHTSDCWLCKGFSAPTTSAECESLCSTVTLPQFFCPASL
ncbi:hypothetical protein Y032_0172g384 [Ancylostoma ceylanicum]|uniref:Uncharacterized protein n=1 Tax=Ancylostoma ceylanicum TaxID=53326 RepID=A0A016SV85_9BILA|nr:hypothetical protein Y032_0172g384 [Ancylostoma ceylanicum]